MRSSIERFIDELDAESSGPGATPTLRPPVVLPQKTRSGLPTEAVTGKSLPESTPASGAGSATSPNSANDTDGNPPPGLHPDIVLTPVDAETETDEQITDAKSTATTSAAPSDSSLAWPGRRLELPYDRLVSTGHLSNDAPKSELAEEFRKIKRPLMANLQDDESQLGRDNVLMVTSCVAGEGKSFCALNLALSLSMERDLSVVLVDADVAKASTSSLLGFKEGHRGLIDRLVTPEHSTADVLYQTDLDNLWFMPVGTRHDHSSELLSSKMMRGLVGELAGAENRILLFDAPPVLQTNEANVLSRLVGQAIFIVAAESTSHSMVGEALTGFEPNCRVGLILNKARKCNSGQYGYAYSYGYDTVRPLGTAPRNGPEV